MKKSLFLILLPAFVLFISCEKDQAESSKSNEIPQSVVSKIKSLELNPEGLVSKQIQNPDGTIEDAYVVEGCIAIKKDDLLNMNIYDGISGEQYHTHNLVSTPSTITVLGYTKGKEALTTKMQAALTEAVANYNNLNIGLTFTLTFGSDLTGIDICVYKLRGSAGGYAGFPSDGVPYPWVRIFSGTDAYSADVNEHVITHELGHCVGLRHTDWFSRESCGTISPEDAEPTGAVHIPGTPTGYDANSLMRSCFTSSEDGEFGSYDEVALEYLY